MARRDEERSGTAPLPTRANHRPTLRDEFPYTIRLVSEVLGSNGSTSMATVCAGTLALMDAGVPIKKPIAGISVGLVAGENGQYATLTDIQGLEDHIGDMDFKVAGSRDGITAIQLDIKVKSISFDVMRDALEQAKEARLYLLDRIDETISEARADLSPYAPRMTRIKIPVDKIGMVIGPGGKTIRAIVEETKATVDVADDGTVTIGSSDADAAARAVSMIEDLTKDIKVGEIYTGKVVKIAPFGAFVQLRPGKDGMVHISELADYRVPSVEDVVQEGEEITVIVIDVDPTGRVKLSRRALLQGDGDSAASDDGAPRPPEQSASQQGGHRGEDRPGRRQGPCSLAAGPAESAAATDRVARDAAVQAVQGLSNEAPGPSCCEDPQSGQLRMISAWSILNSAEAVHWALLHPHLRYKDSILPGADLRIS